MGSLSLWHWIIVLAVVLLLFGGRGKISQLMGDFGKGLQAFKKGVGAQDESQPAPPGHRPRSRAARSTKTPPPRSDSSLTGSAASCHVRHRQFRAPAHRHRGA